MADEADEGNRQMELNLSAARLRRKPTLPQVGQCYNCEEVIATGVFCDEDCRDDYEKRTRYKR